MGEGGGGNRRDARIVSIIEERRGLLVKLAHGDIQGEYDVGGGKKK